MEYLIGVDPGLATGLCLVSREGDRAQVMASKEVAPEEIAPIIREWLKLGIPDFEAGGRKLTVVVEAFIINARSATLTAQPWSLEHIGVVKQCMRDAGYDLATQLVMQKPAVKSVVDNDRLRRVELWHKGGAGHANDALRHVAVRLINVGWRDPRLLRSSD